MNKNKKNNYMKKYLKNKDKNFKKYKNNSYNKFY